MSSRAEAKAKARQQREEAERREAQAAARKRRLTMLGGVLAAAVVVIVVAVVISQSGTDDPVTAEEGAQQANTLFAGIPQQGNVLGDPDAPVTIEEYVDLQCPFCKQFSEDGLPQLVDEYVKTGQAKIVLQTLTFIGADSERGARVAWAAAEQNKMFQFVENFYANQGDENSGYATEEFLKRIGDGVQGLDVQAALDGRDSAKVTSSIQASQTAANKANVDSTPSFLVGPTDGQLSKIETRTLTIEDFRQPVEDALAAARAQE
jgi:protein-disulfide isomerase